MVKLAKKVTPATPSVATPESKVPAKKDGVKVKGPKSKKKPGKVNKRGRGSRDAGVMFIKHLPKGFDEEALSGFFSQFGDIVRVCVARSRKTQQLKGYGYVQFKFYEVAEIAASAVDNYMLFGRVLKTSVLPKTIKRVPLNFGRTFKSKEACQAFHKQRLERRVKNMNKPVGNENAREQCLKQVKRLKRAQQEMLEAGIEIPELLNHLTKLSRKAAVLKGQVQEELVKRATAAEEAAAAKAAAAAAKAVNEAAAADESAAATKKTTEATDEQEMTDTDLDDQEDNGLPCEWKTVKMNETSTEDVVDKNVIERALNKARAAAKKLTKGTTNTSESNTSSKKQKVPSAEKMQEDTENQTTLKKKQPNKKEPKEMKAQPRKDPPTLPKEKQIEKKLSSSKQQVVKNQKALQEKKQQSEAQVVPSQEKPQPKSEKPSLAKKKQSEGKDAPAVAKKQAKKDKPKTFEKKQTEVSVAAASPKLKRKLSIKDATKPVKMVRKVK